jgi:hypothetical protein
MFKNLDNNSDTEDGHMQSERLFKEVLLANLFKKNYEDEGFYSGEETDLTNEEHSKSTRTKEVQTDELHRGELEISGTAPTVELNTITPIVLATLSNQSNQNSQTSQSTVTSSLIHTQSQSQGISMEYEMRLLIFRGDGSEDPDYH